MYDNFFKEKCLAYNRCCNYEKLSTMALLQPYDLLFFKKKNQSNNYCHIFECSSIIVLESTIRIFLI